MCARALVPKAGQMVIGSRIAAAPSAATVGGGVVLEPCCGNPANFLSHLGGILLRMRRRVLSERRTCNFSLSPVSRECDNVRACLSPPGRPSSWRRCNQGVRLRVRNTRMWAGGICGLLLARQTPESSVNWRVVLGMVALVLLGLAVGRLAVPYSDREDAVACRALYARARSAEDTVRADANRSPRERGRQYRTAVRTCGELRRAGVPPLKR